MKFARDLLSVFNRGHAMFVGGAALAQLFPLMSAPIIARLYSPTDFGIYAVFFALGSILAGASALALTNAVLLEAEERNSAHAVLLAMAVVVLFSALLAAATAAVPEAAKAALFGAPVTPYLPWLALTVMMSGVFNCLYSWAVRTGMFGLLARNKLVLAAATALLQVVIGLSHPGPMGFVMANLLGYGLALASLTPLFIRDLRRLRPRIDFASCIAQLRNHHALPLWTVPANLVNNLCSFLPELLINRLFGVAQLGQFSLANRMVNFPLSFLSTSIQDIFRQQAAREFNEHGNCRASFDRFFLLTAGLGIGLLIPVVLLMPYLFPLIFGEQWDQAGVLIQSIAPLLVIRFVSSPLSYVWIVRGYQKLDLLWQTGLLALTLGAFLIPHAFLPAISLRALLWVYGLGVGAWYALCLWASRNFAYHTGSRAGQPDPPVPPLPESPHGNEPPRQSVH